MEPSSPKDEKWPSRGRSQSSASRHVPFDHFARSETRLSRHSRGSQELVRQDTVHHEPEIKETHEENHHTQNPSNITSIVDTLVDGGDFQFDKYLQERYDKAMLEGVNFRQTGVTFKVRGIYNFAYTFDLSL